MINSWKSLPFELQCKIFKEFLNADGQQLVQCQLTCHEWIKAAQTVLFANVKLDSVRKTAKFVSCITSSKGNPGELVRSLNVGAMFDLPTEIQIWLSPNLLTYLIKHCPNIHYLEVSNPSDLFWMTLLAKQGNERWKYIKGFKFQRDLSMSDAFYLALPSFRNSLQSLTVRVVKQKPHSNDEMFCFDADFVVLSSYINQFPHLKSLEIETFAKTNLIGFDCLLQGSTILEHIQVRQYIPHEKNPLTVSISQATLNPQLIKPLENVKHVHMDILINSTDDIVYLTQKFPHTYSLMINASNKHNAIFSTQYTASRSAIVLNKDILVIFADYLSQIQLIDIGQLYITNFADLIEETLLQTAPSLKKCLSICYDIQLPLNSHYPPSLGIEKNLEKNSWNEREYLGIRFVGTPNSTSTGHYPHISLLQQLGHRFDNLLFSIPIALHLKQKLETSLDRANPNEMFIAGGYINDIIRTCISLRKLHITKSLLLTETSISDPVNDSIEELQLSHCSINLDFSRELLTRFMSLKQLCFEDTYTLNKEKEELVLYIPNTSIDNMILKGYEHINAFCFKLCVRRRKPIYYRHLIYAGTTRKITAKEFRETESIDKEMHIILECRLIKQIQIKVSKSPRKGCDIDFYKKGNLRV